MLGSGYGMHPPLITYTRDQGTSCRWEEAQWALQSFPVRVILTQSMRNPAFGTSQAIVLTEQGQSWRLFRRLHVGQRQHVSDRHVLLLVGLFQRRLLARRVQEGHLPQDQHQPNFLGIRSNGHSVFRAQFSIRMLADPHLWLRLPDSSVLRHLVNFGLRSARRRSMDSLYRTAENWFLPIAPSAPCGLRTKLMNFPRFVKRCLMLRRFQMFITSTAVSIFQIVASLRMRLLNVSRYQPTSSLIFKKSLRIPWRKRSLSTKRAKDRS